MERNLGAITAQGYAVCAISYDSVAILRDFAHRRGITYPLLSDTDSSIIRRCGVFNEQVAPEGRDYGIPHPGIFLVDAAGVVRARFFAAEYWHRITIPALFVRLGLDAAPAAEASVEGEHVRVRVSASDAAVSPGTCFTLFVHLEALPGVHVYGPDVGGGYQRLAVSIDAPAHVHVRAPDYPSATPLHLAWTSEIQQGYTRPIRIALDVSLGTRIELAPLIDAGQGLHLTGALQLQAGDDRVCWPPDAIPLHWHIGLLPPDLERVPEALRRTPPA